MSTAYLNDLITSNPGYLDGRHGQLEYAGRLERRCADRLERRGDQYGGNPQVTASFGTVNSIAYSGGLDFINAGASSVTGGVAVSGAGLSLDASSGEGGSSLTIGGALSTSGEWPNHANIVIGNSSLSAASSVEASSLNNCDVGSIVLNGSPEARATMKVGTLTNAAGVEVLKGYWLPTIWCY